MGFSQEVNVLHPETEKGMGIGMQKTEGISSLLEFSGGGGEGIGGVGPLSWRSLWS